MRDALNALYPQYEACCEQVCKILKLWIAAFLTVLLVLTDGLVPLLGFTEEEIAWQSTFILKNYLVRTASQ